MTKIIKPLAGLAVICFAVYQSAQTLNQNGLALLITHALGSAACVLWWVWMFGGGE